MRTIDRHYRGGRPGYYAVLPTVVDDPMLEVGAKFHEAVHKLRYREVVGLSRSLNMSYGTVLRWRYGLTRPSLEVMVQVIEWVRLGKQLETRKPNETVSMF
jgi:hypothetical protein